MGFEKLQHGKRRENERINAFFLLVEWSEGKSMPSHIT